ncbi:MAG: cytochrome c oxidase assembly protein [Gemmatimonadetes bacterium]|nr:cytochrome c oxidase assembly protein [Gemmatimonadota bacterium]
MSLPVLALLHPVADLAASRFSVHPSTAIGIATFAIVYAWRARQATAADVGPTPPQRMAFFTALALLFLTLNGPLHDLSDFYLFSAHMVQHLVLTLVVPPLMIVGTPGWMLRPLLTSRRAPWIGAVARRVTTTAACFTIFNVVLAFWHLPPLYNLALAVHPVHILQHLMFIAASVLMWWPLLSPLPELPRASYPAQMLYCFLMVIPMSVISIYVAMADTLLYPAYATAPRILGISPMQDQQYGGLIMWIPGGVFFYAVMTVVFFKWSQRGEDDQASAQVGWTPSASTSAS